MKVFLTFVVIAFATKVDSQQPQLPVVQFDMNDFMAHQQQHMQQIQQQGRDHQQIMHMNAHEQQRQMEAEEPMVGSPLMGLKMGMPFGIHHALGGLGIPGMKMSNFHMGNIGGLKFGNMLLGSENPNAEEGEENLQGKKWKWYKHKHIEPSLGDAQQEIQHYQAEPQLAAPQQQQQFFPFHLLNPESQQHYQAEPQLAAPPQHPQGFFPFHHHWLNDDSNLGAAQQQQEISDAHQAHMAAQQQHAEAHRLAAQQQQIFDAHQAQQQQFEAQRQQQHFEAQRQQQQPIGPQQPQQWQVAAPQHQQIDAQHYQVAAQLPFDFQPVGPPLDLESPPEEFPEDPNIPVVQLQGEDGARHWGKWGSKGGDSYGYGGYG